jgi:hypothetical protein
VVTQLFEGLYVCVIVENLLWLDLNGLITVAFTNAFIKQYTRSKQIPCSIEKSNTMTPTLAITFSK